jgi:hypothetical protein
MKTKADVIIDRLIEDDGAADENFTCTMCGKSKPVLRTNGGIGYGEDDQGNKFCYDCAAERDKKEMIETGRATLYLTKDKDGGYKISNWPGTLVFKPTSVKQGKHNIAGSRVDVRFKGPDGSLWAGVQYGRWSDILRCRRIKGK